MGGFQCINLVQDAGNALLFGDGRQWNRNLCNLCWSCAHQRTTYSGNGLHKLSVEVITQKRMPKVLRHYSRAAKHNPLTRSNLPVFLLFPNNP